MGPIHQEEYYPGKERLYPFIPQRTIERAFVFNCAICKWDEVLFIIKAFYLMHVALDNKVVYIFPRDEGMMFFNIS